MRLTTLIAGILFLLFATLQYNDSDAGWWAAMFVATGAITLASLRFRLPRALPVVLGLAFLGVAGWIATREYINPGCMIKTDIPGPALCGTWLLWLAFKQNRQQATAPA